MVICSTSSLKKALFKKVIFLIITSIKTIYANFIRFEM